MGFISAIWRSISGGSALQPAAVAAPRLVRPTSAAATPVVTITEHPRRQKTPSHIIVDGVQLLAMPLPATGRGCYLHVVGTSYRQDALKTTTDISPDNRIVVMVVAEPSNQFDSRAVAVRALGGQALGYLSREDAARFQQLMLQLAKRGMVGIAEGNVVGQGRDALGLYLDVESVTVVAKQLGLDYKRVKHPSA